MHFILNNGVVFVKQWPTSLFDLFLPILILLQMPTEASMVPAHAKSVPKPAGDKEPIVDLESD